MDAVTERDNLNQPYPGAGGDHSAQADAHGRGAHATSTSDGARARRASRSHQGDDLLRQDARREEHARLHRQRDQRRRQASSSSRTASACTCNEHAGPIAARASSAPRSERTIERAHAAPAASCSTRASRCSRSSSSTASPTTSTHDGLIRRLFDEAFERAQGRATRTFDELAGRRRCAAPTSPSARSRTASGRGRRHRASRNSGRARGREAPPSSSSCATRSGCSRFDEPVCFIFAHSALKEGWDNPNVFQICTLNQTVSEMKKRQEIGRGLRLAVNQDGERVFDEDVNVLTVVANESYQTLCVAACSTSTSRPARPRRRRPRAPTRAMANRNDAHFRGSALPRLLAAALAAQRVSHPYGHRRADGRVPGAPQQRPTSQSRSSSSSAASLSSRASPSRCWTSRRPRPESRSRSPTPTATAHRTRSPPRCARPGQAHGRPSARPQGGRDRARAGGLSRVSSPGLCSSPSASRSLAERGRPEPQRARPAREAAGLSRAQPDRPGRPRDRTSPAPPSTASCAELRDDRKSAARPTPRALRACSSTSAQRPGGPCGTTTSSSSWPRPSPDTTWKGCSRERRFPQKELLCRPGRAV